MELDQSKKPGSSPDYKGDGVAIWVNLDKNGKQFLSVKLAGHNPVNAWKHEPKQQQQESKGEKVL